MIASCAASIGVSSSTRTVMLDTWLWPSMRDITVVYGTHTLRLVLPPKPKLCRLATPTTRAGTLPSRITWPTGSTSGKNWAWVFSSITATWPRPLTASASKKLPLSRVTPLTRKNCSPTPLTWAVDDWLR